MKKRHIVALNSNNDLQNTDFKKFINEKGCGWWYWIDGFWLLTDPEGVMSAREIREKLDEFYPGVRKLVIELRGDPKDDTWSGYGPNKGEQNMFAWLNDNWPNFK